MSNGRGRTVARRGARRPLVGVRHLVGLFEGESCDKRELQEGERGPAKAGLVAKIFRGQADAKRLERQLLTPFHAGELSYRLRAVRGPEKFRRVAVVALGTIWTDSKKRPRNGRREYRNANSDTAVGLVTPAKEGPPLCLLATVRADLALDAAEPLLVVRDAQRLGACGRRTLVLGSGHGSVHREYIVSAKDPRDANGSDRPKRKDALFGAALLDLVLALFDLTPRQDGDLVLVQSRHEVLPLLDLDDRLVVRLARAREHVVVDLLEQGRDRRRQVGERERRLRARVAADRHGRLFLKVLRAELETDGNTLRDARVGQRLGPREKRERASP